jgi:diadenosine tetraphosphate (Ap4A) HIT family hydrolase
MDDPYAFELDPQLQADTVLVSDWHLCQVRLMNDSRYPWVILIPKVPGVAEIHELANEQQYLLLEESVRLSKALEQLFCPHKLNVAALGNVVRQLHVITLCVLKMTRPSRSLFGALAMRFLTIRMYCAIP